MIHGSAIIQWLDITTQENGISTASKLFQRYSVKAKRISEDEEVITFDKSDNVKVTDWTGWTELQAIHKIKNADGWKIMRVGKQALMVSDDANIPAYSSTMIVGFHGENKYPYIVKEIKDLNEGVVVRVLNPDIEIASSNGLYLLEIDHYGHDGTYGYELITRSKFYNANKFHMYGSYTIPSEMKYK